MFAVEYLPEFTIPAALTVQGTLHDEDQLAQVHVAKAVLSSRPFARLPGRAEELIRGIKPTRGPNEVWHERPSLPIRTGNLLQRDCE